MKRRLLSLLPSSAVARLRDTKKGTRRARYRARQRLRPVSVSRADVVRALRDVGVREGDGVFAHISMSAFGEVEGGSDTVLDAFEEAVGPHGTVALPAFPLAGGMHEYLATDPVFDVRETPSRMGAVTEAFRRRPGVRRSLHPTHSVAASGPAAEEVVRGHADADTPFGAGTPFAAMIERDFVQLWLGTGIRIFTLYHSFECLREGGFPIDVFEAEAVAARCVDEEGRELVVRTLVHDPGVSGRKDDRRERMLQHLLAAGAVRRAALGRGEVLGGRMRRLLRELETLLQQGVTIYNLPADTAEPRGQGS